MRFVRTSTSTRPRAGVSPLRSTLLGAGLLDELALGMLVVALPLIRDQLQLSYAQAGALFTIGALSSLLIEPPINLASDRGSKRPYILGGMVALAGGFVLAGIAPGYAALAVAFALIFPATGAAIGLAQAALIDAAPSRAPQTMTRWTFLSGVGDLLAPLGVSAAVGLGLGWRALSFIGAGLWLGMALLTLLQRFPAPAACSVDEEDGERTSLLAALRMAVRDRTLLRLVFIMLMASMVDEVFLAFVALYLHDTQRMSEGTIGLVLAAGTFGGLVGLAALDRLLARRQGMPLLPWLALIALGGIALLLLGRGAWLTALALIIVNFGAAGWYPIAKAAAYGIHPGQSGLVQTLTEGAAPLEIALPGIAGLVAGRFGVTAAVLMLGLAPLGVLLAMPRGGPGRTARDGRM